MMKVRPIEPTEVFMLKDKNGVDRKIRLFYKKGNLYLGSTSVLFNRHYVCKDKNRIEFTSKLSGYFTELMHISTIFDKIDQHKVYSNFTKEMLKECLYNKGYTDEDFILKPKPYTCCKEHFIEYGFNSMNFCLDKKDNIWVHYKEYEENKQYKEIIKFTPEHKIKEFEHAYKSMVKFIRYAEVNDDGTVNCFALKSINVTRLYQWLTDNHIIHKVNYVSDIYHETLRVLDFAETNKDNTQVKVLVTSDGILLKQKQESELGFNCY
jgi:predicted esterase YcpF (UPF0227 family)